MQRSIFWRHFQRNRLALLGTGIVMTLFFVALLAPILSPYDPTEMDPQHILSPPNPKHWLGTDRLGRDVLSRIVWGSRISLLVGFVSVGIATFIGILVGAIAGYYGRWVDALIMRFVDLMLCFPTFFLILAVIAFLEPSIWNIMVVIGMTGWMGVARLVRAEFLSLKEREFVQMSRMAGMSDMRMIWEDMLPNMASYTFMAFVLLMSGAMIAEAGLSMIGLGVTRGVSLGTILYWAQLLESVRRGMWWWFLPPGVCLVALATSLLLLSTALDEFFSPRLKGG